MFYDPMIAKLITWADTREAAIDRQIDALDNYELKGLGHNIDFLSAVMPHPRFRSGEITTGFIAAEYPEGFQGVSASGELKPALSAAAATLAHVEASRADRTAGQPCGPRHVCRLGAGVPLAPASPALVAADPTGSP